MPTFLPVDEFRRRIDDLIAYLKGMPLAEDAEEILIPGEPEARKAAECRVAGIPIEKEVVATLNGVAAELGVPPLPVRDTTRMNTD